MLDGDRERPCLARTAAALADGEIVDAARTASAVVRLRFRA